MSDEHYEQKSNIQYAWHNFTEGQIELKSDLCYALDTKNLELLESAYKAAYKAIGGRGVGRPKLSASIKQCRDDATALACVYVAREMGISFSEAWRSFFPDQFVPAIPSSETPPEDIVTFYCHSFDAVRRHIETLIKKEPQLSEYLHPLLPVSRVGEKLK
ncbi:hypothetical protein PQY66_00030 [Luminiphilus sp.]|jgi:hypothetical protein|nr:hypothetical protein [Luminiphilus sp.]